MNKEICSRCNGLGTLRGMECPNCAGHGTQADKPFKVLDKEFKTFSEVVSYAWNTYKIDINFLPSWSDTTSEHEACRELETIVINLEKEGK